MRTPKDILERKWVQEYLHSLDGLSLEDLFDEVLSERVPDSYDGCYSTRGWWRACISADVFWSKIEELTNDSLQV
jgi:hypothetical protein